MRSSVGTQASRSGVGTQAPRTQMLLQRLPGGALLQQRRLALEDIKGLLEARQLRLEAGLALLERLGLRDALVLDLAQVLQHGVELLLDALTVGGRLGDRGVQLRRLLGLVLHVLRLRRLL